MKLRDIVGVTFLDHASNSSEPLPFTAYGIVTKLDEGYVVIKSWVSPEPLVDDLNDESFCIIRSCITSTVIFAAG